MSAGPILRLPEAFGDRLTRLRDERKWTIETLAERAGFSTADMIEIECGLREPMLTEFFRIARALGEPPAIMLINLIAEWRGDTVDHTLYKSRPSDFLRLYRLGYQHKPGDFREQDRVYGSAADATHSAGKLNGQRHARGVALLDTVCIYVRLECVHFAWKPDSQEAQP